MFIVRQLTTKFSQNEANSNAKRGYQKSHSHFTTVANAQSAHSWSNIKGKHFLESIMHYIKLGTQTQSSLTKYGFKVE